MSVGVRVRQLRELNALTQGALAELVPGLTQPQLSRIEKGLAEPSEELEHLLAIELNVAPAYLHRAPSIEIAAQSPQLRARSRLTETSKRSVIRWVEVLLEEFRRLEVASSPIHYRLSGHSGSDPRLAALAIRRELGFDTHSPLPYIVLAIERAGVAVLGVPRLEERMDAVCAWESGKPVVAVLSGAPADRVRFSVAHELGHLVLHRDVSRDASLEKDADVFAAELLAPADALMEDLPRRPTLSHLTMLKSIWGLSVKSLVGRCRELGVIDQDRAISMYKQISARGWNRREPGFVSIEKPRALRKMAELAYGAGPNVSLMAREAGWSEAMVARVLACHATADELPYEGKPRARSGVADVIDIGTARRRL